MRIFDQIESDNRPWNPFQNDMIIPYCVTIYEGCKIRAGADCRPNFTNTNLAVYSVPVSCVLQYTQIHRECTECAYSVCNHSPVHISLVFMKNLKALKMSILNSVEFRRLRHSPTLLSMLLDLILCMEWMVRSSR